MKRNEDNIEAAILSAYPGAVVVKTSVGGSWVKSWNPGGKCYENALPEIYAYQAQNYIIKALLFNQGEADTRENMAGAMWGDYYLSFLEALKKNIGYDFPAIHSILGPPPTDEGVYRPNWYAVHTAQVSTVGENIYSIGQWDIPRASNNVHYDKAGYDIIKKRYMAKLAKV